MGRPSLDSIRLRMTRAQEHARDLDGAVQAFYNTQPYEIIHKFDLGYTKPTLPNVDRTKGIHVYSVVTRHRIPHIIPILAGEIMQGMRSALDYIAWQLALAVSDSPPPMTAFPIFFTQKFYDRDKGRFIGGIDPAIHHVFDSVQPYLAGDKATSHALWVLHRLANENQHRIPHVVGSLPSGVGFERPAGVDLAQTMQVGPFDEGDEVATLAILGGAPPDTQLDAKFTFAVAFGKDTPAQGRHLTHEIDRIGREVDATIRKFGPFFTIAGP